MGAFFDRVQSNLEQRFTVYQEITLLGEYSLE